MTSDLTARMHAAFGPTSDPSAYVPRVAFESALAELVDAIGRRPACAALSGEAGLGKTLLLHVLAERLEGAFESLYVPFPRLAPSELWSWAAARLGVGGSGDDRVAVLKRARRRWTDGTGLVLLVDDAGALPRETRAELLQACDTSGFALVMAFDSGDRSHLQALPPHVRRVELAPPMTLAETRTYVHARLRRFDQEGKIAARLGPARVAELHEASGGVPARLHALLEPGLRGSSPQPREVAPVERAARVESVEPVARVTPIEHVAPREAPAPAPREEGAALPLRPTLEPRSTYRRPRRRRFPLGLTGLLVLIMLAGIWRFGADFAHWSEWTDLPTASFEPPREEAAQAPATEMAPVPADVEPPPRAALAEAPETTEPVEAPAAPADVAPPREVAAAPPDVAVAPADVVAAAPKEEPPAPVAIAAPEPPPEPVAPPAEVSAPPPAAAASLAPARPGPRLSVNADPWAEIELDGRPVGETPLGEIPVAPGSHRVSARLPDGRVIERRIELSAGDVYLTFP